MAVQFLKFTLKSGRQFAIRYNDTLTYEEFEETSGKLMANDYVYVKEAFDISDSGAFSEPHMLSFPSAEIATIEVISYGS